MLREPDHVVDSIRRRGHVSIDKAKYRWSQAIKDIYEVHQNYESRTCLIHFTDLVTDPEPAMQKVCDLLGLPCSPKMEEGFKYTPQYDHDHLDPSVATRDVPSYDLGKYDAETLEMYTTLARHATDDQ